MRNLIILAALIASTSSTQAKCSLTLVKRSASSKTAYIGAQSISAKVQAALKTQCNVNFRMATVQELMEVERVKFEKKMKKLKGRL